MNQFKHEEPTEEEKRLLLKYGHKRITDGWYYYWDEKKNGSFTLSFPRLTPFMIPDAIVDNQSKVASESKTLIEVKPKFVKSSFIDSLPKVEKDGKTYIKSSEFKPGSRLSKNFNFIGNRWIEIYKSDDRVIKELTIASKADLMSMRRSLLDEIREYGNYIREIDYQIANVLKVAAKETDIAKPNRYRKDDLGIHFMLRQNRKEKAVESMDCILGKIIGGGFNDANDLDLAFSNNEFLSNSLKAATVIGIRHLLKSRTQLEDTAVNLAKEYSAIDRVLNGNIKLDNVNNKVGKELDPNTDNDRVDNFIDKCRWIIGHQEFRIAVKKIMLFHFVKEEKNYVRNKDAYKEAKKVYLEYSNNKKFYSNFPSFESSLSYFNKRSDNRKELERLKNKLKDLK